MKTNIPKTTKCCHCGRDVLKVKRKDGSFMLLNPDRKPYTTNLKPGERFQLFYEKTGEAIKAREILPGEKVDGYAHRPHCLYCGSKEEW